MRRLLTHHRAPGCGLLLLIGGLTLAGCAEPPRRLAAPQRYAYGLVLVLPGIVGPSFTDREVALGLEQGGVASAVEVWDWTSTVPGGYMQNLMDLERNRREGSRLATRILDYQREFPGRPVYIIGHSGGGGVTVLGLEALPAGREVEMALLLAPALSPEYDLTSALRHVRTRLVNFYSANDVFLLKAGTSMFGTIDRELGPAAGAVGFRPPEGLDAAGKTLYARRLRQVAWNAELWRRYGNAGGHLGWVYRPFVRGYLAPIIQENEARWMATGVPAATPADTAAGSPAAP
ncbi:MAG: hypothetical protein PVJ57_14575 [Phycisphaerae bacterium]|jgi:hypothetical protein